MTELVIEIESIAYIIVVCFCYWISKLLIYNGFKYSIKLYDFFKDRYKDKDV